MFEASDTRQDRSNLCDTAMGQTYLRRELVCLGQVFDCNVRCVEVALVVVRCGVILG